VPATKPAPELSVLREPLREIGGEQVLAGLTSALSWLEANQQEINDLNVFPVPDGDTGSNMYLTLRSAVEEARDAPTPEAADSVLAAAAHGSLMGARGNSGVILSQILRGFAQGAAQRVHLDANGVALAITEASAVAYRAVMKPTEGTILTVVRDAAAAAAAAAGPPTTSGWFSTVWSRKPTPPSSAPRNSSRCSATPMSSMRVGSASR